MAEAVAAEWEELLHFNCSVIDHEFLGSSLLNFNSYLICIDSFQAM